MRDCLIQLVSARKKIQLFIEEQISGSNTSSGTSCVGDLEEIMFLPVLTWVVVQARTKNLSLILKYYCLKFII